jgi:glucose/arabinose dehydrogenase
VETRLAAAVAKRKLVLLVVVFAAAMTPAAARAANLVPIGQFDSPMHVASQPGDASRLFVVERDGRVQLVTSGGTSEFLDITDRVSDGGERGLFSIAFPPEFAQTGRFYVTYTSGSEPDFLVLDEYRASGNSADPATRREVLRIQHTTAGNHNGGQLQFGPDGMLYWSTGDGATGGEHAQDMNSLLGKVLRIDPRGGAPNEYSIPAGNPFTGANPGRDEIWSLGLRNPWRFSFDRLSGAIAIGDAGQQAWEEVDYVPAELGLGSGANFGWPCFEGMHPTGSDDCGSGPLTAPIFEYQNSGGNCVITGGYVVRDVSLGDLYGRYLFADYCGGVLRSIIPSMPLASGERSEGIEVDSPVSFGEDASCGIYVVSLLGPVYRLAGNGPSGCSASPGASKAKTKLKLKAKRKRVARGNRVRLRARATPCPGRAGDRVKLRSGGKKIRAKRLNGRCRARFKVRIRKTRRFRAVIGADEAHLGDRSNRARVRIRRR